MKESCCSCPRSGEEAVAVSSYDYMNGHRQIIVLSVVIRIVAEAETEKKYQCSVAIETPMVRRSQD